jgi:hypothetical protein
MVRTNSVQNTRQRYHGCKRHEICIKDSSVLSSQYMMCSPVLCCECEGEEMVHVFLWWWKRAAI